jgi:hypothetical protein
MEQSFYSRFAAIAGHERERIQKFAQELSLAFAQSGSVTSYKDITDLYKETLLVLLEEYEEIQKNKKSS